MSDNPWSGPSYREVDCQTGTDVTSVTNSDGYLTISPTTGDVVANVNVASLNAALDHGTMAGLADDDHTQYLNTARHSAIGSNPHGVTFTEAATADKNTDITASEAETLTNGSNADSLHTHSFAQFAFRTINCPSGTDPVADSVSDTLNFVSSNGFLAISGNATTDTVTFTVGSQQQTLSEVLNAGNQTNAENMIVNNDSRVYWEDENIRWYSSASKTLDSDTEGTWSLWNISCDNIDSQVVTKWRVTQELGSEQNYINWVAETATFTVQHTEGSKLQMDAINGYFIINDNPGASGTFDGGSGEVITVEGGIITSIA